MKNNVDLFNSTYVMRTEAYEKFTEELINHISGTTAVVERFLWDKNIIVNPGKIKWTGVVCDAETSIIVLQADISYKIGDTLELEHDTITLTADTIEYFEQTIQIALHSVLLDATEQVLYDFLLESCDSDADEEASDENPNFSTDTLTPSQKASLAMFEMQDKKRKVN